MLEIRQFLVLTDNYTYSLRDQATGKTAIVDPSVFVPGQFDYVLNTHHHWDHVGGNLEIKKETGCKVVGFEKDAERIPGIDIRLKDREKWSLGESVAQVLFIPGHTLGHIAYWFEKDNALFCGDTLFSLGCGKLFEGTPEQMFSSLSTLKKLPDQTRIYCGHEYTEANAKFALSLDPKNQSLLSRQEEVKVLRAKKLPTVPSLLQEEKICNPFLTAKSVEEFAERRTLKNAF